MATVDAFSARQKTLQPRNLPAPMPQITTEKLLIRLYFIYLIQHVQRTALTLGTENIEFITHTHLLVFMHA